jgi:hypothetical protein
MDQHSARQRIQVGTIRHQAGGLIHECHGLHQAERQTPKGKQVGPNQRIGKVARHRHWQHQAQQLAHVAQHRNRQQFTLIGLLPGNETGHFGNLHCHLVVVLNLGVGGRIRWQQCIQLARQNQAANELKAETTDGRLHVQHLAAAPEIGRVRDLQDARHNRRVCAHQRRHLIQRGVLVPQSLFQLLADARKAGQGSELMHRIDQLRCTQARLKVQCFFHNALQHFHITRLAENLMRSGRRPHETTRASLRRENQTHCRRVMLSHPVQQNAAIHTWHPHV